MEAAISFGSYSTTPASNVSINGIGIQGTNAISNADNAFRQLAADGRELWDIVAAIDTSSLMPKSGGAFTANITRAGAGAYLYHNSSSLVGGAIYVQPVATALPSSPAEGTIVFQY